MHALARRIAALLVLALLGAIGIGTARAATYPDQGSAYAGCIAATHAYLAVRNMTPGYDSGQVSCEINDPSNNFYTGYFETRACKDSCPWYWALHGIHEWPPGQTCESRPSVTSTFLPKSGSYRCVDGCKTYFFQNGDGTSSSITVNEGCASSDDPGECAASGNNWNAFLHICEPPGPQCEGGAPANSLGQCGPEPCPEGMSQLADGSCKRKEGECPAGKTKAPDGSCIDEPCPAGYVKGADGTCKKDNDNNGEEDEGEGESFSGGDDCNTPPACSGSAILCGQARIQWRIDCNTRKNRNISGGTCSAMPVCTGEKCDAMEYASLLQQWRTACHLETLVRDGIGGGDGGDGEDIAAIRDALTGSSAGDAGPAGDADDAWAGEGVGDDYTPDTAGYGYGRTCPSIPPIDVMGHSVSIDIAPLCEWVTLAGQIVMALAALASLRIVASRE
ncbi:hypothetical protein [Pseudoxanthomonas koreensis]|uniref:hypothetical protein n=1 Tax=Pseudoxanthomonas koreensis TaxID=266061 RepID=UPI0035A665CE